MNENVSWNIFDACIKDLIVKIRLHPNFDKIKSIYGIPRGGLVPAVALSNALNIPLCNIPDPENTLVVDEICDSGKTLEPYVKQGYMTATLYDVADAAVHPTFAVIHAVADPYKGSSHRRWINFPWEIIK